MIKILVLIYLKTKKINLKKKPPPKNTKITKSRIWTDFIDQDIDIINVNTCTCSMNDLYMGFNIRRLNIKVLDPPHHRTVYTVKPVLSDTCVILYPVLSHVDFYALLTILYVISTV